MAQGAEEAGVGCVGGDEEVDAADAGVAEDFEELIGPGGGAEGDDGGAVDVLHSCAAGERLVGGWGSELPGGVQDDGEGGEAEDETERPRGAV